MDLHSVTNAQELGFSMDSSANKDLGFGGICGTNWFWGKWEPGYIDNYKPSIAHLELYAICVGLYVWSHKFRNLRLVLHCDNMAVVAMINKTTSGCK